MEDSTKKEIQPGILPFDNLFLNTGYVSGFNNWWMYVAGISAVVFGYAVWQLLISFPLSIMALNHGLSLSELQRNPAILFDSDKTGVNKNILLAMLTGMFAFALLGLFIIVKKLHHKPILSIITAYNKIRYQRFFFAFCIWGAFVLIFTFGTYFLFPAEVTVQFEPTSFIMLVLVCILLMPIQTSAEEIIVRGYLMQGLALVFKNGIVPLIITSLLFGLLHMDNPEVKTYGWLIMLPYYSLFGFFLGLLTLLDEGLELALGIHLANNLFSSLLVSTPNGVIKTDSIFLANDSNPVSEIILTTVMFALAFFIFRKRYHWKNFKLIIK